MKMFIELATIREIPYGKGLCLKPSAFAYQARYALGENPTLSLKVEDEKLVAFSTNNVEGQLTPNLTRLDMEDSGTQNFLKESLALSLQEEYVFKIAEKEAEELHKRREREAKELYLEKYGYLELTKAFYRIASPLSPCLDIPPECLEPLIEHKLTNGIGSATLEKHLWGFTLLLKNPYSVGRLSYSTSPSYSQKVEITPEIKEVLIRELDKVEAPPKKKAKKHKGEVITEGVLRGYFATNVFHTFKCESLAIFLGFNPSEDHDFVREHTALFFRDGDTRVEFLIVPSEK